MDNAPLRRESQRKAARPLKNEGSDGDDKDAMDVDGFKVLDDDDDKKSAAQDASEHMVPMPQAESIAVLKEKLHARTASLCRPGDRDALLEERRKQRAALREKHRKETMERKKSQGRGEKGKRKRKTRRNQLLVADLPGSYSSPSSNHDGPLANVAFSALSGSTSKKTTRFGGTQLNPGGE
ncbi:hypothetical protein V8E55_008821 [Tylopilus felleus]